MIVKEVIEQEPLTMGEVKDLLKDMVKGKEEPEYVQKKTLEHAQQFARLKAKESKELQKELMEAGQDIERATEIVNLMPTEVEDIRLIFNKDKIPPETEDLKKLLDIVGKYQSKSKVI